MATSHLQRLLGLAACAWLLPLAAAPVTYNFHSVASGSLAGVPFAHTTLTFRMSGDTAGVQQNSATQVQRNLATGVAIALDGVAIGTAQQPLGVSARCGPNLTSTLGIDLMTAVLPSLATAIDGGFGAGATCSLQSSMLLTVAVTATTAPASIATSAGPLVIDHLDSLAFESLVLPPAALKLRVTNNPYGSLSVAGGTFDGTTITGNGGDVVVDLGPESPPNAALSLAYEALTIGPNQAVTFRAGAPGQSVVISPFSILGADVSVQGTLATMAWNGASAPSLALNAGYVRVAAQGRIDAPSGLSVSFPSSGGYLQNEGTIDGGPRLYIHMTKMTGGGAFQGDLFEFWVPSGANHPVAGRFYLANGLHLRPGTGQEVEIIPRTYDYNGSRTFLNLLVEGDARLWMPSSWPPAPDPRANYIRNDAPVLPGATRLAGAPDPTYAGGSMIVQATGSLRLTNGGTGDFVFPGAIVLKAAGTLDLSGLAIVQGWTTSGKAFQGAFFESTNIVSSAGPVSIYTNDLNWVNFSSLPHMPVLAYTLVRDASGAASYRSADGIAPHFNTYSTLIDAAANDACWTCLVDTRAFDLSAP